MLLGWPSEQSMNGKSKIKGALDVPIQKTKGIIVNHVQDLAMLTIIFPVFALGYWFYKLCTVGRNT